MGRHRSTFSSTFLPFFQPILQNGHIKSVISDPRTAWISSGPTQTTAINRMDVVMSFYHSTSKLPSKWCHVWQCAGTSHLCQHYEPDEWFVSRGSARRQLVGNANERLPTLTSATRVILLTQRSPPHGSRSKYVRMLSNHICKSFRYFRLCHSHLRLSVCRPRMHHKSTTLFLDAIGTTDTFECTTRNQKPIDTLSDIPLCPINSFKRYQSSATNQTSSTPPTHTRTTSFN